MGKVGNVCPVGPVVVCKRGSNVGKVGNVGSDPVGGNVAPGAKVI